MYKNEPPSSVRPHPACSHCCPLAKSKLGAQVKVQALQIVDFPNGHVMFAQQLPQKLGIVPMIVHATFQYGGTWGKARTWFFAPPRSSLGTST